MDACKRTVDSWTHRQAIQLVAQLPDDTEAALAVLDRRVNCCCAGTRCPSLSLSWCW